MIQVHTMEQGSDEWFRVRAGLPTASEFSTILAKGKDGKSPSIGRRTYLYKLAGEIITGQPMESYSNAHMERGKAMEEEARTLYSFMQDVDPTPVGFITNGRKGCSPDSLVGDAGGLEIKTKLPHLQIECLIRGELPADHKAQVQGCMWVAEREWWDFCSYWPGLPLFVTRVPRDNGYIANLAGAVEAFNEELASTVDWLRRYGQAAPEQVAA